MFFAAKGYFVVNIYEFQDRETLILILIDSLIYAQKKKPIQFVE